MVYRKSNPGALRDTHGHTRRAGTPERCSPRRAAPVSAPRRGHESEAAGHARSRQRATCPMGGGRPGWAHGRAPPADRDEPAPVAGSRRPSGARRPARPSDARAPAPRRRRAALAPRRCAEEGGEVDDPLQPLAPLLARDPSRQPRRAHLARVRARARARAAALAPAPAARVVRLLGEGGSVPMQALGSGGAPALHAGGQKARARARAFALRPFGLSAPSALAARRRPAGSTAAQRRRSTRAPGGRFTRPVRGGRGPRARHSA